MSNQPQLSLLLKKDLPGFSSASAIEMHDGWLYVIGDDSRYLVVLDKHYNIFDTVMLFPGEGLRIPKKEKSDLEASTIVEYNGKDHLLVAGSASTPEREVFFLFPLNKPRDYQAIPAQAFYQSVKQQGLHIINIEGLVNIRNKLLLANRANESQPQNHFITVQADFLYDTKLAAPVISTLKLPQAADAVIGVSGLAYVAEKDLLLFTASVELTDNAVDDGDIGNSYLGYISGFSMKMQQREVLADGLINLSELQAEFANEKIESVCVESAGDNLVLHLVADNDNGTSTLFKVSMPNPAR
ncbi:MAG TPA: hypothetical protein VD993_03355 [Chitinophagaceae bacterium]|nr:hypothetical protein [Chitinophagaceae bacterium]